VTSDQRFEITIAAVSLVFTILCVTLGVIIRAVRKFTQVEDRLADVMQDIRDDRAATNERLTYLERNVWPGAAKAPSAAPRTSRRVPKV
jgi:hypothetical protein